jgi:hypothetical protein
MLQLIKEKIEYKRYVALSLITYIIFNVFFIKDKVEFWVLLLIYISILINHVLFIKGLNDLVRIYKDEELIKDKSRLLVSIFLFIMKFFIVVLAFFIAVHFVEKRIIIGLIFFLIKLIIFVTSLKK